MTNASPGLPALVGHKFLEMGRTCDVTNFDPLVGCAAPGTEWFLAKAKGG